MDIVEILKNKPKGTKLYSPVFGNCYYETTDDTECPVEVYSLNYDDLFFYKDGKYDKAGEIMLFPSKEMRDWNKFGWKKGDVLIRRDEFLEEFCIFDSFHDAEYEIFNGKFHNEDRPHFNEWHQHIDDLCTEDFHKASDKETDEIIKKIEKRYGGTLDLSTLEIVKAETVDINDIKKSYEDYVFKPKEWCLMQTIYFPQFSTKSANNPWTLCQFSHKYGSDYVAVGGNKYDHCIPYNDDTMHLLGKVSEYKE